METEFLLNGNKIPIKCMVVLLSSYKMVQYMKATSRMTKLIIKGGLYLTMGHIEREVLSMENRKVMA